MKHLSHKPRVSDGSCNHDHEHGHSHDYKNVEKKRLILAMVITGIVMVVEFIGGYLANSLALISDGGHMFTHMFALGISWIAIVIASRETTEHRTYGYFRMEVLAALLNSVFLFIVTVAIVYEGFERLASPEPVKFAEMFSIALIGLAVNIVSVFILQSSAKNDMNIKAAFFHVIADALSSVGVVAAAIVIYYTDWYWLDPILAMGIALLIALWAFGLFRDSVNVLLETVPKGMQPEQIKKELLDAVPEITGIHDMHIWVITSNMHMFSAHVGIDSKDLPHIMELREKLNKVLVDKHGIDHTTIEFDLD